MAELEKLEDAGDEVSPDYERVLAEYEKLGRPNSKPFAQIKSGEVWRLVTPAFLHFGPLHLIFNMMWLWTLGGILETFLRRLRFVLLVIIIAVISNLAQALA